MDRSRHAARRGVVHRRLATDREWQLSAAPRSARHGRSVARRDDSLRLSVGLREYPQRRNRVQGVLRRDLALFVRVFDHHGLDIRRRVEVGQRGRLPWVGRPRFFLTGLHVCLMGCRRAAPAPRCGLPRCRPGRRLAPRATSP